MPTGPIRLSVVIPTWNAAELTSTAIHHLLKGGEGAASAELIIVDDGSEDGTAALIRSRFPGLTVIEHESNRGFGAAINTGFKAARGGFLGAVNNDVRVSWECLERLTGFLQAQPRAGAAAPLILNHAGQRQRVGFDFPRLPWGRRTWSASAEQNKPTDPRSLVLPYSAEYLRGACVVFNRAALQESGLFDEQFHMFAEEIDLFRRLFDMGWSAWVVPDVAATHVAGTSTRNHEDSLTAARFRQQSYRSMCLYYRKHHTWSTAAALRGMLAARVSGRVFGLLLPRLGGTEQPRSLREYLGYLTAVLRPCSSRPRAPSLPALARGDR